MRRLFSAHNTKLPTLYTLVKTHKIPVGQDISELELESFKMRPIISCIGSPTQPQAWLVTQILNPLLNHVPSHLSNIHSHLQVLSQIPQEELSNLSFFSADIVALYTNLVAEQCINNVLELAEEHWDSLETFNLLLHDIRNILEVGLNNSYFTFNNRLYILYY